MGCVSKGDGKETDFTNKCQRINNIVIFGIEEWPRETYFEILKIRGHFRIKIDMSIVVLRVYTD